MNMKLTSLTTFAAAAMLAVSMSAASAQNAAGPAPAESSPSNLNAGSATSTQPQSGSEMQRTQSGTMSKGAMSKSNSKMRKSSYNVKGKKRFCIKTQSGNALNCNYTTMAACEKVAKPGRKACTQNPRMSTTGSGGMGMKSGTGMK